MELTIKKIPSYAKPESNQQPKLSGFLTRLQCKNLKNAYVQTCEAKSSSCDTKVLVDHVVLFSNGQANRKERGVTAVRLVTV